MGDLLGLHHGVWAFDFIFMEEIRGLVVGTVLFSASWRSDFGFHFSLRRFVGWWWASSFLFHLLHLLSLHAAALYIGFRMIDFGLSTLAYWRSLVGWWWAHSFKSF